MVGKLRSVRLRLSRPAFCVFGLLALVALAGCGRNFFLAEREPWRRDAEVACLKSGTVKESAVLIRSEPIRGPGMCGADFPLKVTALGEGSSAIGYADTIRPPGAIPNAGSSQQPNWPITQPRYGSQPPPQPQYNSEPRSEPRSGSEPRYSNPYRTTPTVDPQYMSTRSSGGAIQSAPLPAPMQVAPRYEQSQPQGGADNNTYMRAAPSPNYSSQPSPSYPPARAPTTPQRRSVFDAPPAASSDYEMEDEFAIDKPGASRNLGRNSSAPGSPAPNSAAPSTRPAYQRPPERPVTVPMGPRTPHTGSVGPVEIKPAATLACPIVSALDRWLVDSVQPAALRWFNTPVIEIRQISAYSCRGMNGQPGARISEHAFGNALDIAAFILADGRKITIKDGWRGTPEEQGFLRDVQGAACEQFTTVLAPGSNRFHYDHIHVDLMRRASGNSVCNPDAVPGDVVAARVAKEFGYAWKRNDPNVTGSIAISAAVKDKPKPKPKTKLKKFFAPEEDDDDWVEDDGPRPRED
jgi:hypothetical protein